MTTVPNQSNPLTAASPKFTILVDGACPLCRHESRYMAKLDRGRGLLKIVDIAAAGFDPSTYCRTMEQLMGSIHGVKATGEIISGVEVFREAYGAVGRGWMLSWTAWPLLKPFADRMYIFFCKVRLKLPGRHDIACTDGVCKIPGAKA